MCEDGQQEGCSKLCTYTGNVGVDFFFFFFKKLAGVQKLATGKLNVHSQLVSNNPHPKVQTQQLNTPSSAATVSKLRGGVLVI